MVVSPFLLLLLFDLSEWYIDINSKLLFASLSSGSGVGLIRSEQPAAEITKQVRDEAVAAIKALQAFV